MRKPPHRIVEQVWRHDMADQVFDAIHKGAVRATATLGSQPEHTREMIRAAVKAQVEALREGEAYVIPVLAALAWTRRP